MTLSVKGLSRRFSEFALEGIELSLGAGEYWVLLGPSGCGKSMLLHTLTGLIDPDAGQILLAGRDATREPPETRGIGLVFQQSALFPHLSVTANIEYGLRARKIDAAERRRRVDELVQALGLAGILNRPVATLSGGEAQRVAIARALAIRPALLLLDEPLSLLDHNARLELQGFLKQVHQTFGLTTLHVTHNREEAFALGDHCAVMNAGRIVQRGTVDEVRSRPCSAFVAEFLGLPTPLGAADCKAVNAPGH